MSNILEELYYGQFSALEKIPENAEEQRLQSAVRTHYEWLDNRLEGEQRDQLHYLDDAFVNLQSHKAFENWADGFRTAVRLLSACRG